jgi:hypothetical protein
MRLLRRMAHVATILSLTCSITCWFVLGCYAGVSDSDTVEVVQTTYGSPNRVAMLVERSDHAALSGNTFIVFVADHPYSLPELRRRLYALPMVFMVDRDGIVLRWSSPNELTIQCQDCAITRDMIQKQRFSDNGVAIRYVGFP